MERRAKKLRKVTVKGLGSIAKFGSKAVASIFKGIFKGLGLTNILLIAGGAYIFYKVLSLKKSKTSTKNQYVAQPQPIYLPAR
jgi:hypothetical protein